MTNAEKYLKDEVTEEFIKRINERLDYAGGQFNIEEFLKEQATPTLTEDERVILRNIPKEYTVIRRNEWCEIEFVKENKAYRSCYLLSHLFQFIKERRRIPYCGTFKRR